MAMQLESHRQALIEQVLEYWYTVDFLAQGGLNTEQTRRDRESLSFAMSSPHRFTALFRHENLKPDGDILENVSLLENTIRSKREMLAEHSGQNYGALKPPCHGKITVFLGLIDQSFLSIAIANELNCELPQNPSSSKLALASLQLTDEGRYIRDTFSLSPVIWSLGRILSRESGNTMYETLDPDVYENAEKEFAPEADSILSTYQDLKLLLDKVIDKTIRPVCSNMEEAGLEENIHYNYNIYKDAGEKLKRETDDYMGLSMSFYAADLAKFRKAAAQGNWFSNAMWETLADYICAPFDMEKGASRDRIDLGSDALNDPFKASIAKNYLKSILSVDSSPWGKWPSSYQPFFMQQVAINLAVNNQDPIFAVNGPPGTGKTTLLKEIVADNVVQRALILSEYDKPDQMFISKEVFIGHSKRYLYSFRPDMKDIKRYGIIVASSNNNAVENISKQLPLVESLEKHLKPEGETLSDVQKLFSLDYAHRETVERMNFDKEGRPKEMVELPDIYFSSYASDLLREPSWGLISAPLGKKSNILAFYKKVLNQLKWDRYLQNTSGARLERYHQARTDFLEQYRVVGKLRNELKQQSEYAENSGLEEFGTGDDHFVCLTKKLLDDLASENTEIRKKAQMANVRLSKRYDHEREKLFAYALSVTKEFILSSECCKQNLDLLSMAWGVDTYQNVFANIDSAEREKKLRECMTPLIQTLQLLVPVISTTFASAGRFFKYITKADALGTIVVDEAGQATPQMALSLFSKASRAIVVGDPNQIDPVVSDELAFLESTLDEQIGCYYSDRTISVQKIADWLSVYGSEQSDVIGRYGKKWVGLPLYVHSRCVEPMFAISNRLSYGDNMLRITREPGKEKAFCYPTSQWINVSGKEESKKNHFIREQGNRVMKLLDTAFEKAAASEDEAVRAAGPDIFVISPFHTVAEGMRNLLANEMDQYPNLLKNKEVVENWLTDDQYPHIGTVHTFQGREADEVILLLGCDEQSTRSANWVNRNIVNVAVSRAKYRLYAVGDGKVWRGCDSVMEMKFDLDTHQFDLLAAIQETEDPDADLFEIPELPSSEMFDISDLTDKVEEEEYQINTSSAIGNIRAGVPELAEDFTQEQLACFGFSSMEEFDHRFDARTKDLLRTGMWTYFWIKPFSEKMPEYDASTVGICFCKAFEQCLKDQYFIWLQKLFPEDLVHGVKVKSILADSATIMIGDTTTLISAHLSDLAAAMNQAGKPGCDFVWWNRLSRRIGACRTYRNKCAHPGETFLWTDLEDLISDLFRGREENDGPVPGLMLDDTFRSAMENRFGCQDVPDEANDELFTDAEPEKTEDYVKYCPVVHKIHVCPADNSNLVQEIIPVMKKDGKEKKLTMLICRQCGRRFINTSNLPATLKLDDYCLTAVKSEEW